MNYLKISVLFFFIVSIFLACDNSTNKSNQSKNPFDDVERLENINLYLTEKDKDIIESYIRRQGWRMQFSDDGYFFELFNEGANPKISEGKEVEFVYTISLLDGTVCYQSDEPKSFLVGQTEEITGLHLAVKKLGKGGSAKFIFPPQLAYGLPGNLNKIPPRSVIIYDIKIINVK